MNINKFKILGAPVAQWIRCVPPKDEILGSSPSRSAFLIYIFRQFIIFKILLNCQIIRINNQKKIIDLKIDY